MLIFIVANASGKVITDTIQSISLQGNLLNDPSIKPLTIYLPPSYDESKNRYPVIYYLHGFPGNNGAWTNNYNIHGAMDSLIKQGKVQEMIIVMPNSFNKYGGSWYANSSVAGNYESYITQDLVNFIDGKYRTLPLRDSRAIAGGSMGGHGSMKLALKNPDVYCAVVSHSGLVALEVWVDSIRLNPNWNFGGYLPFQAMAIGFSPNPNSPKLYDYPADDKGNLIPEVWERWLEHDPVHLIKAYQEKSIKLKGIYFDHGKSDTTVNVANSREMDKALTEAGIEHTYMEYEGGHFDQWPSRLYIVLPFLSKLLNSEAMTRVESFEKKTITWGMVKRVYISRKTKYNI